MKSTRWEPSRNALRNLRGMIIDRNTGWRADPTWAPVIESAIREGIETLSEERFWRIHNFLWTGGLPGNFETYGFDEKQMAKAWRRYLKKHGLQPVSI